MLEQSAAVLRAAGAKEVFVFGSAAKGQMDQHSDVDLAVSGLPPRAYLRAKVAVGNLFGRSVDLVDLDVDSPFTRYLRAKEGLLRRVA